MLHHPDDVLGGVVERLAVIPQLPSTQRNPDQRAYLFPVGLVKGPTLLQAGCQIVLGEIDAVIGHITRRR